MWGTIILETIKEVLSPLPQIGLQGDFSYLLTNSKKEQTLWY